MATDREFQEAIARCVSVMVYYHNDKRSPRARATMTAEIQAVAGWVLNLGLSAGVLNRDLLKGVEEELIARYGRLSGSRLDETFVRAFEGTGSEVLPSRSGDDGLRT